MSPVRREFFAYSSFMQAQLMYSSRVQAYDYIYSEIISSFSLFLTVITCCINTRKNETHLIQRLQNYCKPPNPTWDLTIYVHQNVPGEKHRLLFLTVLTRCVHADYNETHLVQGLVDVACPEVVLDVLLAYAGLQVVHGQPCLRRGEEPNQNCKCRRVRSLVSEIMYSLV